MSSGTTTTIVIIYSAKTPDTGRSDSSTKHNGSGSMPVTDTNGSTLTLAAILRNERQQEQSSQLLTESQVTAIYVISATLGMLLCLLLATCHQRRRRAAREAAAAAMGVMAGGGGHGPGSIAGYTYGRGSGAMTRAGTRGRRAVTTVVTDVSRLAGTDCPICLDGLDDGTQVRAGICNHPVHNACLSQWLAQDGKTSCPVCRATFLLLPEGVEDDSKGEDTGTGADTVDMQQAQSSVIGVAEGQHERDGSTDEAERTAADMTIAAIPEVNNAHQISAPLSLPLTGSVPLLLPPGEVLDMVDTLDSPTDSTVAENDGSSPDEDSESSENDEEQVVTSENATTTTTSVDAREDDAECSACAGGGCGICGMPDY